MKHDITIRSLNSIQEVRLTEDNEGKVSVELTFVKTALSDHTEYHIPFVPGVGEAVKFASPPEDSPAYRFIKGQIEAIPKLETSITPTQVQLEAQEALKRSLPKLRKDPEYDYDNIKPEVIQAGNELTQNLADTLKPLYAAAQEEPVEKAEEPSIKKERKRRKPADTSFDLESSNADIPESIRTVTPPADLNFSHIKIEEALPALPDTPTAEPVISVEQAESLAKTAPDGSVLGTGVIEVKPEPINPNLPSEEQLKNFRARLFVYTNDILPKAGLVPTEGIGGVTAKVRLYAQKLLNRANMKDPTVQEWETFLTNLDNMANDPALMVLNINQSVGA